MSEQSKLAVIFPGQGSQSVGMLKELAEANSIVQETFQEASDALGENLWQLVQEGPQESLNLTENAQPALLASSVAVWRVISSQYELKPLAVAGHSLGEWSALVCADVVEFADAVKLVRLRGQYMQMAVPVGVGSMAAIIGLDDSVVEDLCSKAAENEVVAAVNYNSQGQVVIAGHVGAVDRAIALCKESGAKRALPLSVSAPFHTSLMKPAADKLAADMAQVSFKDPAIPVVHNVHATTENTAAGIRAIMEKQIYSPVRWVECVNGLRNLGAESFIECGPGKVLSGLLRRIDKSLQGFSSDSPAAIESLDCLKSKAASD